MNKLLTLLSLAVLMNCPTFAQYHELPNIPDKTFDIKTLGAVGNGKTPDTQPIQQALKMAGKDGGKVIIPPGTYLCGPLVMEGKTELVIEKGAVLKLINDIDQYPVVNNHYRNFIELNGSGDFKISGEGTIDGQGRDWWTKYDAKQLTYRRPQLLFAEKCTRVEITGVTFLDPPNTHMSLKDVDQVYIHHITINAPSNSHNTDGINISATNCTIDDCDISTGDDNIAINFGEKGNTEPECAHILVKNCRFGYGHGLSVGSYTSGGLRDLKVQGCTFDGTSSGIRIKSAKGRGGIVEQLSYEDITMKNVKYPVAISCYYPKEPPTPSADTNISTDDHTPVYRDITIKNLVISSADYGIRIWGLPGSPVKSIHFENCKITSKEGSFIYNATGVNFDRCSISNQKGEPLATYQAEVKGF